MHKVILTISVISAAGVITLSLGGKVPEGSGLSVTTGNLAWRGGFIQALTPVQFRG